MRHSQYSTPWICSGCSAQHQPVELHPGQSATCKRCGTRLFVRPRTGPSVGLAWSLTALILFSAAAMLPLLEVTKLGNHVLADVHVVEFGLSRIGMQLLGIIAGILVFWLPLIAAGALFLVNLAVLRNSRFPGWRQVLKVLGIARSWAMPEVFLLAVAVAFIKIGDLAETHIHSGLWLLMGGTVALLAAMQRIERDDIIARIRRERPRSVHGSNTFSATLMLGAFCLLIPANILPILEMRMPGDNAAQTLMGGVSLLLQHNMIGIALVVFIASMVVPFAKIIGLAWLLWSARCGIGTRRHMQVYRILNVIGRWSMLDVFLVALLSGLIHFGSLAEVRPGAATPVFAVAVILTALAVEHFDTRHLWTPARSRSSIR